MADILTTHLTCLVQVDRALHLKAINKFGLLWYTVLLCPGYSVSFTLDRHCLQFSLECDEMSPF